MDSLTQITLGAAVGEVVLGKKIGNRAMVWGAVGGTIPDLDVLGEFFMSKIDYVAFHRGISHSITFSVLAAIAFGWIVYHIYKSPHHKWIAMLFKIGATGLVIGALNVVFSRFFPGNYVPLGLVALSLALFLYRHIKKQYFSDSWEAPEASMRNWQWLFFWSLVTHPLLDCFTMYGTEVFAPFSSARIAWSTIAVADPLYTLPFIICLLVAARFSRESNKRRVWNTLGIAFSSAYLMFTVVNKQYVNQVFTKALVKQGIAAERFVSNPVILNNIVWNCTAETEDHFYMGQYGLFDGEEPQFYQVKKDHSLLKNLDSDPVVRRLRWFTKDYFNVYPLGSQYQINDLRFGSFSGKGESKDDFIFRFRLSDQGNAGYQLENTEGGPPEDRQEGIFGSIWRRIKGIKE